MDKADRRELLRDVSDAPASLKRLAQVVGWPKTLEIGRSLAGARIYIPARKATLKDHPLSWIVGRAAALRLAESDLAGGVVEVPRYFVNKERNLFIRRQGCEGLPVSLIAMRHRMSRTQVKQILSSF